MRSVADELRQRDRESVRALSGEERIELALRLGDEDLAAFCEAQGVDRTTGVQILQRRRQAGRTPSKCISDLIG